MVYHASGALFLDYV